MPIITLKYDRKKVDESLVMDLSVAVQKIVSEETQIEDVFVYADSPVIMIKAAPIELFVQLSQQKIDNLDGLTARIKNRIATWKDEAHFPFPINFTFIPMDWKIELNI